MAAVIYSVLDPSRNVVYRCEAASAVEAVRRARGDGVQIPPARPTMDDPAPHPDGWGQEWTVDVQSYPPAHGPNPMRLPYGGPLR